MIKKPKKEKKPTLVLKEINISNRKLTNHCSLLNVDQQATSCTTLLQQGALLHTKERLQ